MAKKNPVSKGSAKKATKAKAPGEKPAENGARTARKAGRKVLARAAEKPAVAPVEASPQADAEEAAVAPKGKPAKSPLNKKEIAELREALLEKRRTLLGDMTGMEAEAFRANRQDGSGDLSTMPVHMADIGTDNYEQEFTLGLLESERQLLREIDEALARMDKGTYGICLGTGQPISKPRLKAKPWAKYCIEYARMLEQGLARQPSQNYASPTSDEEAEDVSEDEEPEEDLETEDEMPAEEADEDVAL